MGKVMKTTVVNEQNVSRDWYVIDAEGQTMGRIATRMLLFFVESTSLLFLHMLTVAIMLLLLMPRKSNYRKERIDTKMYHQYSGYAGGLRSQTT